MEENFKQHLEYVERNPLLFGDFRTALEEAEPRLYEDVQDYEATKAVFQEVVQSTLFINKLLDWWAAIKSLLFLKELPVHTILTSFF